jgi:hypothetical protein
MITSNLTISNLFPDTTYSLYCVGETPSGPTSFAGMITNRVPFRTHCCKRITVKLNSGSFIEGTSSSNIIQVMLDSAPTSDVLLQLSGRKHVADSDVFEEVSLFYPNQITLTSGSWSILRMVSLLPSPAGDYQIALNTSSTSPDLFDLYFESSNHLKILTSSAELPAPELGKAQFSNDGTVVSVSFTGATDRGQFTREFSCSLVFIFTSSEVSRCYFADSRSVVISPRGVKRLQVNESIAVLPETIRSQCSGNSTQCFQKFVESSSTLVLSSTTPITPVVVINAPKSTGSCDSPRFDLSSSFGGAGREWSSFIVRVTGNSLSTENLNSFFASKVVLETHSPMTIPQNLLSPGVYLFEVQLCNFLGACGKTSHQLEVRSSPLPALVTVGSNSITQTSSQKVSVQIRAYQLQCNGSTTTSASMAYEWSISQNGVRNDQIRSISKSPSHFLLGPYTLQPGSFYEISVAVTAKEVKSNGLNSATFFVNVVPSKLVLLMKGSTRRFLRKGTSISIDTSGSYDPDSRFTDASFDFKWNCHQQVPALSSQCGLLFDSPSKGLTSITPSPDAIVGSVFVITMTIFDSSRETSSDIFVTIGESTDPTVIISPFTLFSGKWNPAKDLSISGTVSVSQPLVARWKSEDSLALNGMNLTSLSKLCLEGTNQMNLVLRGGSLLGSNAPYTFTLSVDGFASAASIVVTLNTPPLPGSLYVSPTNGTMLATKFSFSASMFIDEDLPITYQFSYLVDGRSMVLQSRSGFTSTVSVLPGGPDRNGGQLTCLVNVYDGLDSSTSESSVVTVLGEASSVVMDEYIRTEISTINGDSDSMKRVISISVAMLNQRNCLQSPDCSSLHRSDCSETDNTCGPCLDGFHGDSGDGNSTCLEVTEFAPSEVSQPCEESIDCSSIEICLSGECQRKNQTCSGDCNAHGVCETRNIYTGLLVSCAIGDSSCRPSCVCESEWKGKDCSVPAEEFLLRESARTQLLLSLTDVSKIDEPTDDQVRSWIDALSSITQNQDEISLEGANLVNDLATVILNSTSSSSDLLDVLGVLDISLSLLSTSTDISARRSLSQSVDPLLLLEQYGAILSQTLVPGQVGQEKVYSSFRLSSQVMTRNKNENIEIVLPQSPLERATGVIQPHCTTFFETNELTEFRMSAISMKATLSQTAENISSSLLSLQMDDLISSIVCTLPSNVDQHYYDEGEDGGYLNVTCANGDYSTHSKICPRSSNTVHQKTLTVSCRGLSESISLRCPVISRLPVCTIRDVDSSLDCFVQSYSSSSVTCECKNHQMNKRRLGDTKSTGIQVIFPS